MFPKALNLQKLGEKLFKIGNFAYYPLVTYIMSNFETLDRPTDELNKEFKIATKICTLFFKKFGICIGDSKLYIKNKKMQPLKQLMEQN